MPLALRIDFNFIPIRSVKKTIQMPPLRHARVLAETLSRGSLRCRARTVVLWEQSGSGPLGPCAPHAAPRRFVAARVSRDRRTTAALLAASAAPKPPAAGRPHAMGSWLHQVVHFWILAELVSAIARLGEVRF